MIVLNNLINFHLDNNKNTLERVLWIDKGNDIAYLIDIYSNYLPYSREISEIEESLNNGTASVETLDPFLRVINEMNVSEKDLSIREKAWESIKDIIVLEPFIFNPTQRRKIINEICKSKEVHESTILRYLKRYWKRGKTKNALLPDYYLCGGLGKEKEVGQVKRGRPRKSVMLLGEGINIDEEIRKIFKTSINKYYYTSSQKTLTLTYELMLKEFFSKETKIKNNEEIPIISDISHIPTFAQFKLLFIKKDVNR